MGQGALKDVYNDYKTIGISVLFANTNGMIWSLESFVIRACLHAY